MLDNNLLDIRFTTSFYKHILGIPINFYDLKDFDEVYYNSLQLLLTNSLTELNMNDLTFSIEIIFDTMCLRKSDVESCDISNSLRYTVEVVDLVSNGRNIKVTDDNKVEYVRLVAQYKLSTAYYKEVSYLCKLSTILPNYFLTLSQIEAFLSGFFSIIPPDLIAMFKPSELELLLCGLAEIDINDLYNHTKYHGYRQNDPTVLFFWQALHEFNQENKLQFLQFVTGKSFPFFFSVEYNLRK